MSRFTLISYYFSTAATDFKNQLKQEKICIFFAFPKSLDSNSVFLSKTIKIPLTKNTLGRFLCYFIRINGFSMHINVTAKEKERWKHLKHMHHKNRTLYSGQHQLLK